jgi:hypothetical protein
LHLRRFLGVIGRHLPAQCITEEDQTEEKEEKDFKLISWKKKQGRRRTFSNRQLYGIFILALTLTVL